MARLGRGGIAGLAALAAACSLTSLDGYSGGVAPGSTPEAGTADAAADAPEAPADARSDVSALPPCASRSVTFCDDFDEGAPFARWSGVSASGVGEVALEGTERVTPPSSVRLKVPPSGTFSTACLARTFTATNGATSFRFEADLFVEQVGSQQNLDLVAIARSRDRVLGFEVGPNGRVYVDEDVPVDGGEDEIQTATAATLTAGKWTRVAMEVVLQNGKAATTVFVDGASVVQVEASAATFVAPFDLELGDCSLNGIGGPSGWSVLYDNVSFDMK